MHTTATRNRVTSILDGSLLAPAVVNLGSVLQRTDLKSSMVGTFHCLPNYTVRYPQSVIMALADLYREYNDAFIPAMLANMESKTDYQRCIQEGLPVNFAVQIDMVGLPDGFLKAAAEMPHETVREILRRRIFEIENSLAMYQLLERAFPNTHGSFFSINFRAALGKLRRLHGKKIALLAVTQEKYNAMLGVEFGKAPGETLTSEEVLELSGFDAFFGPNEFRSHLEANGVESQYLLYARTSEPVEKLKKPELIVEHPLLSDENMRRAIKANVVTFNIDAPQMDAARKINDTKEYQPRMGMGFQIHSDADLFTPGFTRHLFTKGSYTDFKGQRLSDGFISFLEKHGTDPGKVESGEMYLRAKPLKGTYGCYGHLVGSLSNGGKFRSELRRNLRQRDGGYIIQPEMTTACITNQSDGVSYTYIDRNFFAMVGRHPRFLGGFRSLMPVESVEAKSGRNHGNDSTVWAEITA